LFCFDNRLGEFRILFPQKVTEEIENIDLYDVNDSKSHRTERKMGENVNEIVRAVRTKMLRLLEGNLGVKDFEVDVTFHRKKIIE
jgi:hypothetical protein